MNDLRLDQHTHDLEVFNLDLSIVQGAERVRQQLLIKLKLWQGEWFLDLEFGTPYFQEILGKQITLNGAVAALKKSIMEVADVSEITRFTYDFQRAQRKLKVDFEVNTPFGLIGIQQ